jgi:hypothetical protein
VGAAGAAGAGAAAGAAAAMLGKRRRWDLEEERAGCVYRGVSGEPMVPCGARRDLLGERSCGQAALHGRLVGRGGGETGEVERLGGAVRSELR